jgi:PAS domain S-box-containing protein
LPIEKVIELNYPLMKNLDFYWQIDHKNHQTIHTGYALPYENRAYDSNIFAFPVQISAHSQNVIYIRCATPNALFIEANLWEPSAFQKQELGRHGFHGFYFGILLSIFLFTLGLTIATKDIDYLIYLCMIFFMGLAFIASRGFGAEYVWPNIPWLTERGTLIFGLCYFVFQLLFICRVLLIQQLIPRFYLIAKGVIALNLIMPMLVSYSSKWFVLANILIALTTAFVFIILVIACLKKQRDAYIFSLGFSLLIIGILIRELHAAGLIETNFYSLNSLQFGSAFGLLVFTFYLTDRYRIVHQENNFSLKRLKNSNLKLAAATEAHSASVIHQVALKNKAEKLRTILELSPDGISISDLEGTITFVSDKTMSMWGYTKKEFLGKPIFDVIDVSSHETVTNMIAQLLKGNSVGAVVYNMVRKDGSHFICEANSSLIYDIDNKPTHILFVQRDVTERIKLTTELELAKEMAEQANLAKSVFVSHMSHELRTPLNVILGYSELLQMDNSITIEQLDFVQEILKGGNHLLQLINQMLDLSKIESGHIGLTLRSENISTIIDDCLVLTRPLAQKKTIKLRYQHKQDIFTLCDRTQLIQLLLNLIANAIKYNVNQGTVDISVELNDTKTYTIHVIDSGIGMDPERLAKVFDPYVRLTTTEDIEGTGLGLSIVQKLVKLMDGTIGVKSEQGVGSHFWITIPLMTDVDEPIASAIALPSTAKNTYQVPESTCQYQVLYVDDNASNLKLTANMFRSFSHLKLATVQDSTLAIAQALLQCPDVILLDINMPEMDGYQVLKAIQANDVLKTIPVIALSANSMVEDIERGRVAGFSHYLSKPVDQTVLIQTIDQVLGLRGQV